MTNNNHDLPPKEKSPKTPDELLHAIHEQTKTPPPSSESAMTAYSLGIKITIEFISTAMVGAGLGYIGDIFFNTRPILTIVMGAFGVITGIYNIFRKIK